MPTPRVAAIHDMSGFGRCSLTVAIPVLSAMGVQCCPLPTAYLSTHTGGFTGYTFLDMTDELPKTAAHWAELGIHFDAVYTGFMGSEAQMDLAADFVRTFRRDRSTIFICDPVMGDHGKIYKTYTPAMCAGMTRLAELADVIVPNLTEAAVLLGEDHSFGALTHDEAGYRSVVERLSRNGTRSVVLTGVMLHKGEIGACVFDRASGGTEFLFDTFIGKEFHGTGDVFASVLTGALVKGKTLHEAVRLDVANLHADECAHRHMHPAGQRGNPQSERHERQEYAHHHKHHSDNTQNHCHIAIHDENPPSEGALPLHSTRGFASGLHKGLRPLTLSRD